MKNKILTIIGLSEIYKDKNTDKYIVRKEKENGMLADEPKIKTEHQLKREAELLQNKKLLLTLLSKSKMTNNQLFEKLNFTMSCMVNFLQFMTDEGFINKVNKTKKIAYIFSITEKGLSFINKSSSLLDLTHFDINTI